jgi:hypothetical protein
MESRKPYLWTAPDDCPDPIGKSIMTVDLVAGLKKINPRITMWEEYPSGLFWPGKKMGGNFGVKTSLWVGDPGGESAKISAITAVVVPEFTQISKGGLEIIKGWRSIFEKCIFAGAATREQIEAEFKVSLTIIGQDFLCHACVKIGKRVPNNGGVLKLCRNHENIARAAAQYVSWREANKPDLDEIPSEVKNVHVSL